MRIVDRTTFLTLPPGTLYAKVPKDRSKPNQRIFSDFHIKGKTIVHFDSAKELSGCLIEESEYADFVWCWDHFKSDDERFVEFDFFSAEALHEPNQLFVVFSRADHIKLIQRLITALGDTLA